MYRISHNKEHRTLVLPKITLLFVIFCYQLTGVVVGLLISNIDTCSNIILMLTWQTTISSCIIRGTSVSRDKSWRMPLKIYQISLENADDYFDEISGLMVLVCILVLPSHWRKVGGTKSGTDSECTFLGTWYTFTWVLYIDIMQSWNVSMYSINIVWPSAFAGFIILIIS